MPVSVCCVRKYSAKINTLRLKKKASFVDTHMRLVVCCSSSQMPCFWTLLHSYFLPKIILEKGNWILSRMMFILALALLLINILIGQYVITHSQFLYLEKWVWFFWHKFKKLIKPKSVFADLLLMKEEMVNLPDCLSDSNLIIMIIRFLWGFELSTH